ncbi:MAG: alpha/beta hydrolase [Parachlamydia sp.]|jgi:pimeloyl-ACP methyl ester carboxylesterase|nr:alpha/beta hydrolase [Parachlamydia sp.]
MSEKLLSAFIFFLFILTSCERHSAVEIRKQNVNNIELAYYTRGQGEPLLLIMGFRGTMSMWDPQFLAELEKKYTLILFDNRGAGFSSDTENNDTTISQMAQDAADLLDQLGYKKAHILGWSMGSRIAMDLALQFPEKVRTLILCSPNPGGKRQAVRRSGAYAKLLDVDLSSEEGLSLIFPDSKSGKKASKNYLARLMKAIEGGQVPYDLRVNSRTVKRQKEALALWDENQKTFERLSSIKVPTLAAGGGADSLDSVQNVAIVAEQIPFAWTAYYPQAGHNFISQEAGSFAALVDVFIKTNQ